MLTFQVAESRLKDVLRYLKTGATRSISGLDDLTAIDESARRQPDNFPDYTMVYHLLSFDSASRAAAESAAAGSGSHHVEHYRYLAFGQLV